MVPPLPKEASVIRHTSVRGLKRQSDERKRDRESGQFVVNGDSMVCRNILLLLALFSFFSVSPECSLLSVGPSLVPERTGAPANEPPRRFA